ncbi:hypothetical protein QTP70_027651 [Hemibagrus guttatus]|uniref:Gypsy retrotransposon integrase-like protein 1 n=1 Tax=Hemibagrus guttatus TaxID=175788 RepID=A0AAE0UN86_9TELE|nr:hypothetical protein QTP70_027651 [Hemibagrus guttatus]
MHHRFVVVYIDDILIYSPNLSDHVAHVKQGIRMDCTKVEAIKSWPQPSTVKDLQHFLGFANFYGRFISGYSDLTAPLTSLLRKKPKNLSWTSGAIEAFWKLKAAFCTAPILVHADPTRPFIVEVDASVLGVVAVLSQWRCETPADALSRIHSPDPMPEEPEPILSPDLFVCPITLSLDNDIRAAIKEEPAPPGGPDGIAYVPTSLRLSLLDSVHASPGSGHPGRQQTLSLLKERYWWPNMAEDVARFARGCSVCAIVSTSCRLPEGKLVPLLIPRCPWSHLDHFSKACKLIPLKGLPTALETAEALFSNVFRHFGIPEDIMSDRVPQFISRVWRGFFKLLGCRAYCYDHQHDWSQYLPWAEYAQNSLHQESSKLTPFQCILGYQTPLFPWSAEPSELPTVDHWFRESERVTRSGSPLETSACPRYIGPFTILRQIYNVTYELQLSHQYHISPTFHMSLLKPFIDSVLSPPTEPEVHPPPEIDTDDTIYQVREVVNSRRRRGRFKYLVDWEGYGPEERSWVDQNDILDPSLLVKFHQRHQGRPDPRGHGRPRRRSRASGDARGGGSTVTDAPTTATQPHPQSPEF